MYSKKRNNRTNLRSARPNKGLRATIYIKPRKVPESADNKDGIDGSKAISVPFYNGSHYNPVIGRYVNAVSVEEALNGAYLTRSIDRNGLMRNNKRKWRKSLSEK